MAMSVTISRANQNRKYNSNMADVRFLKSEVLITQAWFEVFYRNLLLLKPKVDFQLYMAAIFKVV